MTWAVTEEEDRAMTWAATEDEEEDRAMAPLDVARAAMEDAQNRSGSNVLAATAQQRLQAGALARIQVGQRFRLFWYKGDAGRGGYCVYCYGHPQDPRWLDPDHGRHETEQCLRQRGYCLCCLGDGHTTRTCGVFSECRFVQPLCYRCGLPPPSQGGPEEHQDEDGRLAVGRKCPVQWAKDILRAGCMLAWHEHRRNLQAVFTAVEPTWTLKDYAWWLHEYDQDSGLSWMARVFSWWVEQ